MPEALPRYETDQLISIIGNKRSVQQQLRVLFEQLLVKPQRSLFVDPFCGSGAVARIARSLGCRVAASDVEPFTFITNYVYLSLDNDELNSMFTEFGGLDAYLTMLNLQGLFASTSNRDLPYGYLSTHYAPRDDQQYDGKRERLFFTRANALFLDAIREEVEHNWISGKISASEKCVILSSLLYEASRKANTSGTFTSYHKQFGSYEAGARSRITTECSIQAPMLIDAPSLKGTVRIQRAEDAVANHSADLCFLDPPATVHQYGGTCHLLNSIAMWDKPVPDNRLDQDGNLIDRSGMRKDKGATYSEFCSLKHAGAAMVRLLNRVDARTVVLTYPRNALVDPVWLDEMLRARFKHVRTILLHKRNQGGRQPATRSKEGFEQVIVADQGSASSHLVSLDWTTLSKMAAIRSFDEAVFRPCESLGPLSFTGGVLLDSDWESFRLEDLTHAELDGLASALEASRCQSVAESLVVLMEALAGKTSYRLDGKGRVRVERKIISLVRKARRCEDSRSFTALLEQITDMVQAVGNPPFIVKELAKLSGVLQTPAD